jgi:hypothetical protein
MLPTYNRNLAFGKNSAYLRQFWRADERTRTAYSCSLRVITHALQGCAGDCKCRIFRGVSFPYLAECCTVLRSRWYQSGINRGLALSQSCSLAHASEVRPAPRRPHQHPANSRPLQSFDTLGGPQHRRWDGGRSIRLAATLTDRCNATQGTFVIRSQSTVVAEHSRPRMPNRHHNI